MEYSLILTAKKWELASQLERTRVQRGIHFVKNVPERTYLAVTPEQWIVLQCFAQAKTVPQVLELAIEERFCPELGEFYELILKAVRARVLVEPAQTVTPFPAANWSLALRPERWRAALWFALLAGVALCFVFPPPLSPTWAAAVMGTALAALVGAVGVVLAATFLRGAGGEVYVRRWRIIMSDACMLSSAQQRIILVAPLALMAAVAGGLAWRHPPLAFPPLIAVLWLARPLFGGAVNALFQRGAAKQPSDAEQRYIFPPNRTVSRRWQLLRKGLRAPTTWLAIFYGIAWTLSVAYFFGALSDLPPWRLEFWQVQGPRLGLAAAGSLVGLGVIYLGAESYVFLRDRARARHETFSQWRKRWFGYKQVSADEAARHRAVLQCPPLRMLPPTVQQHVAKAFKAETVSAWKELHAVGAPVSHLSLILSGRVGVYRVARSGRRVLVHTLAEHDLVGLHAVVDPQRPDYLYRTLTPVLLLRLEWAEVASQILPRLAPAMLANHVQKIPFLTRISLCQNWNRQAIQRFAELSQMRDYAENETILTEGFFSENFFIVLEGEARVTSGAKRIGSIGPGSFFGEIGLLQNSNATARVVAMPGARCLCIARREFLRFVAHNHTVALELERVSSHRIGRPIFPMSPGDFKTI